MHFCVHRETRRREREGRSDSAGTITPLICVKSRRAHAAPPPPREKGGTSSPPPARHILRVCRDQDFCDCDSSVNYILHQIIGRETLAIPGPTFSSKLETNHAVYLACWFDGDDGFLGAALIFSVSNSIQFSHHQPRGRYTLRSDWSRIKLIGRGRSIFYH